MEQLPNEIIVQILKLLNVKDIIRCSQVCQKWENLATEFVFQPQLKKLIKLDESTSQFTKTLFYRKGWTESCQDSKLITLLYQKYVFSIVASIVVPKISNACYQKDEDKLIRVFLRQVHVMCIRVQNVTRYSGTYFNVGIYSRIIFKVNTHVILSWIMDLVRKPF